MPWSSCAEGLVFCLQCHRYWGRSELESCYGYNLDLSCVTAEHEASKSGSPTDTLKLSSKSPTAQTGQKEATVCDKDPNLACEQL